MTLPKHRTATRPHGLTRYQYGPAEDGTPGRGCRCTTCRRASYLTHIRYQQRVLALGGKITVPAQPVRDHVRNLMDAGLSAVAIAEASDIPRPTIDDLIWGQPSLHRPPSQRVTRPTADALLDVPYSYLPARGLAPAIGARRRLRALTAIGWPTLVLNDRLGLAKDRVFRLQSERMRRIKAPLARAVRDLYDDLWDTNPTHHGVEPHHAEAARRRATKAGWALPMHWDDDEIDNPHAAPYLDHEGQVWFRHATTGRRLIDEHGLTIAQAAERLGISAGHLNNCLTKMRAQQADTSQETAA